MTTLNHIPAVSILMPVRNEERFLPAALRSIEAQTFTDWELVAVDDGSTDGTPRILAEAAAADPRIRVLHCGEGLVPALNLGLNECRASLVARMDGDDVSHPRRLAAQVALLAAHPEIGLAACSFRHFPRQGVGIGMAGYEQWQNRLITHEEIAADLFVESPFVHPSVMYRRCCVERLEGYRDRGWPEDYDLWLRLAAAQVKFARLAEPLFFWRERPERTTRTNPAYAPDAFRRCKLHHLMNGFLKGETEVILAGAGLEGRAWYRLLREEGIRVAAWLDVDPRKIGRQLHGAPVLATGQVTASGVKLLMTVGARGARALVRESSAKSGFVEGIDAACVA
ncbi:Glycosyl transferase, group 2 family [Citrifermentans bremense]|uniref:Glycosyl transferase, group 2 family n=1 Tax=Citrifermentans bremense TaxID=60035 RepID=A0A6S6LYR0_9BACT|nr:glycosyltransferase [Citrifermentans bremense]BCG46060.1 Glycosyl transferase, group 2 family [Citrifermentans bremense]